MLRRGFCVLLVLSLLLCATPVLAESEKGLAKYDTNIEVTFGRSVDDTLETNVLSVLDGATVEDNIWIDAYRDYLGIDVKYDWIVNSNEYTQKVNLAISSGDIPDVLGVSATQLQQMAEAELIVPLGDLYEEYATEFTKTTLVEETDTVFDAAMYDGQLYGLPETGCSSDSSSMLWIRTDWLEKLNLEVPTTMEELMNVMEAFVTQDPDGNGVDDTYGMVLTKSLWDDWAELEGFFNGYGAYIDIWVDDGSGKLVYGSVQPEVRTALEKLNELYEKKYINPEFSVEDGSAVAEYAINNQVGIFYGPQWVPLYPLQTNHDNNADAQWTGFSPVFAEGVDGKVQNPVSTSTYYVVSKDCENPEAIVKMYNLFLELCWGETGDNGVYYAPMDCEGIWKLSPIHPSEPFKNINAFRALEAGRQSGDNSNITGEAASILLKLETYASGSEEGHALWGWERIYGSEGVYRCIADLMDNQLCLVDAFSGAPTETMTSRMSTLDDLELETFTNIITGRSTIDAFDEWVTNFNDLGGAQITEEVNAWYDTVK